MCDFVYNSGGKSYTHAKFLIGAIINKGELFWLKVVKVQWLKSFK